MVIINITCHKYLAKHYFCLKVFLLDIIWNNIILESMEGESDEGGQLMQSFLYDVPPCPPSSLFGYLQWTNVFFDKSLETTKELCPNFVSTQSQNEGSPPQYDWFTIVQRSFSLKSSHFNYFSIIQLDWITMVSV